MKKDKPDSSSPEDLRRRAEKLLAGKKIKDIQKMTEQDVRALAHELQVHHIELEMQNEELRRTRSEAEDALSKYTDLYDFAPVGYFTFGRDGTIVGVNLAGAVLLGVERCNLIDKRFQLFVKPDSIPVFNTFCNKVLENNTKETCELELMKKGGSPVYVVLLEGVAIEGQKGKRKQCRAVITDITAYKHEEEKIHLSQKLSMAISKAGDMQSLLDIILRRVTEVAGWVYGEIWIPSSDGKYLEYGRAWYRNPGPLEEFAMRSKEFTFPPGIGIPGRVWATKQLVWINDVTLDPNYLRTTMARDAGLKAAFAFPLFAGEEVVAVIVSYAFEPIEKNEHLVNLLSSISTHLGWVIKRKQIEEIQHMAYNDTLTSLPNRLQFKDRLVVALAGARRSKTMLAVMFIDLDGFKVINDTLGHAVGDQVLQGIAGRLRSCMRETDTVSRLGGDEFTIVLPKIGRAEDAAMIAKKIIEVAQQPLTIGSNELIVTTSIGIALFPDDGKDVETLMKHADIAMYHAKKAGKNNYQFFVSRNPIA